MADAKPSRPMKTVEAPAPDAPDSGVKKDEAGRRYTESKNADGNTVRAYLD